MNTASDFEHFIDPIGNSFLLSNDKTFLKNCARALIKHASFFIDEELPIISIKSLNLPIINRLHQSLHQIPTLLICTSSYTELYIKESLILLEKARINQYRYYLKINELIPSFANKLIFYSNIKPEFYSKFANWNCHSMALGLAGIYKTYHIFHSINQFDNLAEISYEELEPGDIINFSHKNHSILYLNNQICFSCNGLKNTLKIYSIESVLATYKVISITDPEVKFYRKPDYIGGLYNLIFEQIDLLINYYEHESLNKMADHVLFNQSANLMQKIYRECFNQPSQNNPYFKSLYLASALRHSHVIPEDYDFFRTADFFIILAHITFLGIISYEEGLNVLENNASKIEQYKHLIYHENSLIYFDLHLHKLLDIINIEYQFYSSIQIQILLELTSKLEKICSEYETYEITKIGFIKKSREAINTHYFFSYRSYPIKETLSYHFVFSMAFVLDCLLWFIDPYRMVFGVRSSILKFAQPKPLTEIEFLENEIEQIEKTLPI